MTTIYKTRLTCRLCGHGLEPVLDLGDIYLNDFVDEGSQPVTAPLMLSKCVNCTLVQLQDTSDLDRLYRQYWYKSSLNKTMITALQDVVDNVESRVELSSGDVVVDIGCNDGTMLSQYTNANDLLRIGFDPALNLASEAKQHCDIFHNTYFGDPAVELPVVKVFTAIAMFYDLEDPHTFVEIIKQSLALDGIWVIQFTDLMSMLKVNAFDSICHEHLEYYSFAVLHDLMAQHGLEIFDVEVNDVNGCSVRAYVAHVEEREVLPSVMELLTSEAEYMNSFVVDPFHAFVERIVATKFVVTKFVQEVNESGKTIFAMGASTKGNTLLQYFNLDSTKIAYAAEVNADKFGKKTVGTNIPIISECQALDMDPDYFLILPWHFTDMLLKVHRPYLYKGGRLVVPMPIPTEYYMVGGDILSRELV